MTDFEIKTTLLEIADDLISDLVRACSHIREGIVMTTGPAPYRRLDCDGRALAYVRTRPKKRAVRVDVTGLWRTPRASRLIIPTAGGSATLLIRSEADRHDATEYLLKTVEKTRDANSRKRR